MEPKPRGIRPERTRIGMLPWVQHAAAEYSPTPSVMRGMQRQAFETNITRGKDFLNVIENTHTQLDHPPSILIGGLGLTNNELVCSIAPQKIAARLHRLGIPYQLTLVDNNPDVISDVRTRRVLYQTKYENEGSILVSEWASYLADTGQHDSVVTSHPPDLIFHDGISDISKARIINRGVHAAAVPEQFHTDIANGTVKLLQQDMAWANLNGSRPFDYVSMQNLLMYADTYGQQMMVANAAAHTNTGGYMLLNDPGERTWDRTFSQNGGWLTDEKLRNLHLEVVDSPYGDFDPDSMLLRKY